jgi:type IV pilus assembly protein PilE
MDNRSYTADFTDFGFTNANTIQSEAGYYAVTIAVPTNGFSYLLTATPQGAQAGDADCTTFTLDSNGTRGATGANTDICW